MLRLCFGGGWGVVTHDELLKHTDLTMSTQAIVTPTSSKLTLLLHCDTVQALVDPMVELQARRPMCGEGTSM